jgi:malate dehydrogenase (oxaloacetate-decarboxylating)(NADP+)
VELTLLILPCLIRTEFCRRQNGLILIQQRYAIDKKVYINKAIKGADVFLGLSAGNVLSADMLLAMADNPVVFAMASS